MLGRAYEASLAVRRRYYNNQCEFNTHIERPDHVLYFVHGFGGAPGQAELVEASIASVLGRSYHLHCMSIPALQVSLPEYLKYSPVTADKIRIRIVDDLHRLARDYDNEVILMAVSSHGMYDFVYAYPRIPDEIRHRIRLLWVACAADDYEQIRQKYRLLTRLLSWLTGFEHGGYLRYYSLNHPWLRWLNPECATLHRHRTGSDRLEVYRKRDIEFRFRKLGVEWTAPWSLEHLSDYLKHQLGGFEAPITDIKCHALCGLRDGYWHEPSRENFEATVSRYFSDYSITCVQTSHLWVATPEFFEPFLRYFAETEGLIGR